MWSNVAELVNNLIIYSLTLAIVGIFDDTIENLGESSVYEGESLDESFWQIRIVDRNNHIWFCNL